MALVPLTTTQIAAQAPLRVGCVNFLNALPLITGLENAQTQVVRAVPSALLGLLEQGAVDVALCPVADLMLSQEPLTVLPVGGIGCDGPTLTVRLYSRVPLEQVRCIHADTDSHTSVRLSRVLLAERYGTLPKVVALTRSADGSLPDSADCVLLIGDKVITGAPDAQQYPHQLDAGEAWKQLTGLPFVFAVWMVRACTPLEALGDLPQKMDQLLTHNLQRLDTLAAEHAADFGWPIHTALHYMRDLLRYRIESSQRDAIQRFLSLCSQHGLTDVEPMVRYWPLQGPHLHQPIPSEI